MFISKTASTILTGLHAVTALISAIFIFVFNISEYYILFDFDSALPDVKLWYHIRDYLKRRGEIQSVNGYNPESGYVQYDGIEELEEQSNINHDYKRNSNNDGEKCSASLHSFWYPRIVNSNNFNPSSFKFPNASNYPSTKCAQFDSGGPLDLEDGKRVSKIYGHCPYIPPPKADNLNTHTLNIFTPRIEIAKFGNYELSLFPFNFVFRKSLQTNLREIVHFAHNVCANLLKINCWLDSGTLLGAIRDQDIFYWDHDADMALNSKDFPRLQKAVLNGNVRSFAKEELNSPHLDIILQGKGRPHSSIPGGATFLPARVVDLRSGAYYIP